MTYIKEKTDKDLMEQWKQETGLNLYKGGHDKWAVDREQKSYLTFRTSDHELPEPGEEMCRYYDFLYQNKLYRLALYYAGSKDDVMLMKARDIRPKPNLDDGEFSKNLDCALTEYQYVGDLNIDRETKKNNFHVLID